MPGQKMYRFAVRECRGPRAESVHLSQMQFCRRGEIMSMRGVTASNPGGENPPEETPEKAIDGHDATNWHDLNKCPLVLTFPALTEADAFRFITASDYPERDPVSWTMEGSRDGNFWTVLHRQDRIYETPRERRTPTAWIGFQSIPAGSASAAVRRLREGASFELHAPRHGDAFTVAEWLASLRLADVIASKVDGSSSSETEGHLPGSTISCGGSSASGLATGVQVGSCDLGDSEIRMLEVDKSVTMPDLAGDDVKEKAAVLQMLQARGVLDGLTQLLLEGAQQQVVHAKPAAPSSPLKSRPS